MLSSFEPRCKEEVELSHCHTFVDHGTLYVEILGECRMKLLEYAAALVVGGEVHNV